MKNKSFDCVEMKSKGAEAVYKKVATLSIEQQLAYWRNGSAALRQQMKTEDVEKSNRYIQPVNTAPSSFKMSMSAS